MLRRLNRGEKLTQEELGEIANNFILSVHAKEKIAERHPNANIKEIILNPIVAYYNTDKSINIALNKYEYIVIAPDSYKVITFKEKSWYSKTVFDKQDMARNGYDRKY